MNKQIFRSIILSVLLTGFGIFCLIKMGVGDHFSTRDFFGAAPENGQNIVYLYKETSGVGGQGEWFLNRVNREGKELLQRPLRDSDENFRCLQCTTDERGYTYVLMEEDSKQNEGLPPKQYVTVYDSNFNKIKTIFMTKPDAAAVQAAKGDPECNPKLQWRMRYLQHLNGDILSVEIKDRQTLVLHIYNSLADQESMYTYTFPNLLYIGEVITDGRGGLYLTDDRSRIFHILFDGTVRPIAFTDFKIPYRLSVDSQKGILYFTDIHNFTFVRYQEDSQQTEIIYRVGDYIGKNLNFEDVRKLHYDNGFFIAYSEPKYVMQEKPFFYFINGTNESFQLPLEKQSAEKSWLKVIKENGYEVLLIVSLLLSLVWAKFWAHRIIVKVLAILPVVVIGISFVFTYTVGNFFYTLCENYIQVQFYIIANYIANDVEPKDLRVLQELDTNTEESVYRQQLAEINESINLRDIYNMQSDVGEKSISQRLIDWFMASNQDLFYYTLSYTKDGETYLGVVFSSQYVADQFGTSMSYMVGVKGYRDFLKDAQTPYDGFTAKQFDMNSVWISSVSPVRNEHGDIGGYVEVGMSQEKFNSTLKILQNIVGITMGIFTWIFFLMILALTYYTLRPLNALREGVEALGAGKLDTVVDIQTNDEFEEIGNAFNKMAWQIKSHMEEITIYSNACARFIPFGLFRLIGKERIQDIVLGDQTVKDVIILSVDVIFSSRIKANGQETFLSLNQLFTIMVREIDKTGGIIESYFNTGLRAIYPDSADEALDAALRILDAIEVYNSQHPVKEVSVQVALASGKTMIGIIGSDDRMEAVLMAENVDQVECLQRIANTYRVHMLLTESVCQKIEQPSLYELREVGTMQSFVENGSAIKILNCLNGEPLEFRKARLYTKTLFEEGVAAYAGGDYLRARKLFIDVVRVDGADELAKVYIFLCDSKQQE